MSYQIYTGPISRKDEMDPNAKASFEGGYRPVLLPAGFVLWRFVSQLKHNRFGIFWMEGQAMTQIMEELHHSGSFSQGFKKENIRNSLAILNDWSHLNWRMKIRLSKDVVAFAGKIGVQSQFDTAENHGLTGGPAKKLSDTRRALFDQLVIPSFRGIPDENSFARIEHFAHI